jgi:hypothetical protein
MPGIFDMLIQSGLLSALTGQGPQGATPTRATRPGAGAAGGYPPQQTPTPAPAQMPPTPVSQAMSTAGESYDDPDTQRALLQATAGAPVPSRDPFTDTYNASAAANQQGSSPMDFLQKLGIKTDRPLDRLSMALMAAGSKDPAATLSKLKEEDSARNKPKVTPLQGGAFSMITYPDGSTKFVKNEEVAKYVEDITGTKFEQALQKAILQGQIQSGVAGDRAAIKTGEEARPILNETNSLIERWSQASQMIEGQGIGAQVQGMFPGIAGFFGGDQVASNKFLQSLTVDETLLNTAKTKGAISNAEMALFKSPIPSATDDREKVWKPWIEKRLEVLRKLKTFYEGEVARGSSAGSPAPTGSLPPPPTAAPATAPAMAPAPSGGGGASMTVPGLSPNASRYFQ